MTHTIPKVPSRSVLSAVIKSQDIHLVVFILFIMFISDFSEPLPGLWGVRRGKSGNESISTKKYKPILRDGRKGSSHLPPIHAIYFHRSWGSLPQVADFHRILLLTLSRSPRQNLRQQGHVYVCATTDIRTPKLPATVVVIVQPVVVRVPGCGMLELGITS